ncbi:MAG: succinate dehydrogenase, cytochrome b556 subunit [Gammaproteobacteria bacterium]|nr:succinate dehydrogenase, cytochrome b556 subunit [Gammaproteobacteria bacterium]
MAIRTRPISPHLQIYKPQLTSVLSITHRATGIFLALGTVMLVYWIMAIASGPDAYNTIRSFFGSVIGKLLLLGWSYALFYHLCNGIRHLFWDIGMGFEMRTVYISGWAVVVASLVLTLSAWLIGYAMADNV